MARPYWWFQGASVMELYERLKSAGPDVARLEVRQDGNSLFLDVVGGDGSALDTGGGSINESHICPPQCP